jgi:PII-like signaling protein
MDARDPPERPRSPSRLLSLSEDLPAISFAVDARERIEALVPAVLALEQRGVVTLERAHLLSGAADATPGSDEHGFARWQRLTVYSTHAVTHGGVPLHSELVRRLRAADAAGATAIRGIWGYHGEHAPQGDRFFQVRRHVPVATTTIDTPEQTARSFAIVDELTREHGLVISETVPALRAVGATEGHGGLRPARLDR